MATLRATEAGSGNGAASQRDMTRLVHVWDQVVWEVCGQLVSARVLLIPRAPAELRGVGLRSRLYRWSSQTASERLGAYTAVCVNASPRSVT